MSSTNKTTHYDLSQYVAADKPTYLVDYNADMSAIDTAIYNADSLAQTNEAAIGNLTLLDTTIKTDLVSAVNEVEGEVGTLDTTVAGHTTSIATNTAAIGTLANLETVIKTNLVSAINELNSRFDLSAYKTYTSGSSSSDLERYNVEAPKCDITIATNNDGSIFKIYGVINAHTTGSNATIRLKNTGINPTSGFNVSVAGTVCNANDGNYNTLATSNMVFNTGFELESNGDIIIPMNALTNTYRKFIYMPCLYFAKDFGDQPE